MRFTEQMSLPLFLCLGAAPVMASSFCHFKTDRRNNYLVKSEAPGHLLRPNGWPSISYMGPCEEGTGDEYCYRTLYDRRVIFEDRYNIGHIAYADHHSHESSLLSECATQNMLCWKEVGYDKVIIMHSASKEMVLVDKFYGLGGNLAECR